VTPAKQVKQRLKTTSRRANRFINYVSPNTASYFSLFYLNQGSVRSEWWMVDGGCGRKRSFVFCSLAFNLNIHHLSIHHSPFTVH
jgi:hypothetical protein